MKQKTVMTASAQETMALGQHLAQHVSAGDIICLFGDLGAGKTTLVKGLAQGLKIDPDLVNSPTYVLMNIYEGRRRTLYHFDLYRLQGVAQIEGIGYDEFFYGTGVSVVEWSERLGALLPAAYLRIEMAHDQGQRRLVLWGIGAHYESFVTALDGGIPPRRVA